MGNPAAASVAPSKPNVVIQDEPKGNRQEVRKGLVGGGQNYIKTCRRPGKLAISLAPADRSHCCFISGGALWRGSRGRGHQRGVIPLGRTHRSAEQNAESPCPARDLLQWLRAPQITAVQFRGPSLRLENVEQRPTHAHFREMVSDLGQPLMDK